jgi:hypothetical protein
LKVLKNDSSRPIYAQSECIIEELGRKHKCIFQENLTLLLWKFCRTDKNMRRIKENVDSRNIKSRFHCSCMLLAIRVQSVDIFLVLMYNRISLTRFPIWPNKETY